MGIRVAITPTGVLLAILIIVLLAWMVTFTYLALRRTQDAGVEEREAAIVQPKTAVKQLAPENFSKISPFTVKPATAYKKSSNSSKEAILEQSVR